MSKIFTFIVIAVAICIQSSRADDKPEGMDECLKKSGATVEDILARPNKNTNEIRCFRKCMLEKQGMIDGSGSIHKDLFDKAYPKAAAHFDDATIATLKACIGSIEKISNCDDMVKVRECFKKAHS
uniref:Uncharacterized protein LOC114341340 isoform X1 n=1 Tax=Diabrotica virgifera virgifera TaxID=50390 RepID=A0A6P7GEF6_DIAVI